MAITKIGTPELFDFSATNTALQLPTGDTASRPAAPSTGEWRFNTTLKYVEYWDGGAWRQIDTESSATFTAAGNFNTNTYFGTGATQAIDAKFNEAANFNGSSSKITISDDSSFSPSVNPISISCWIKTTSTTDYFISKGIASNYEYAIYINGNGQVELAAYISSGASGVFIASTSAYNDGNWHHVVGVFDPSGNFKIYVDGSQQATSSTSVSMSNGTSPLLIGTGFNSTNYFNGSIDQVRIFNDALTSSEVTELYNETASDNSVLNYPAGAGCIAAYPLQTDAVDLSGNYSGASSNVTFGQPGYLTSNTDGTITSTVAANVDAGFSIVKYTGNETASQTVGHGLSSPPEIAFIKQLDGGREWQAPL